MKNIFKVKSLFPQKSGIFCHIFTINDLKIVVDCGIGNDFDYSIYTDEIKEEISTASCILVTSFEVCHFGAIGLFTKQKVFCSVPTATIGKIMLDNAHFKAKALFVPKYDNLYYSKETEDLNEAGYSLKEDLKDIGKEIHNGIEDDQLKRFDFLEKFSSFYYTPVGNHILNDINVKMIKYSQPFFIGDVEICAYNAGSIVGNCLFKIRSGSNALAIGYNLNHRKENYLDGFSDFFSANVFVTNSRYPIPSTRLIPEKDAPKRTQTLQSRDDDLNEFIRSVKGKVVISVPMSRLVELLLIIQTGVYVVSNINIMDRVRSMAEWAGSRASGLFEMNNSFGKIEGINKKVIAVISDYGNSLYLGNVLSQIHGQNDALIIVNPTNTDLENLKFPIYDITYEIVTVEKLRDVEVAVEENFEEISKNWYERQDTVFLKDEPNAMFPLKRMKLIDNDYGETVNFKFAEKVETEFAPIQTEKFELENIKYSGKFIEINAADQNSMAVIPYFFQGVSDLSSIKTVLEGFSPQKTLIVPESIFCANLLASSITIDGGSVCIIGGSSYIDEISNVSKRKSNELCNELSKENSQSQIEIELPKTIRNIKICEEIIGLPFRTVGNKRIRLAECFDEDDQLYCKSDTINISKNTAIGSFSSHALKKELIRCNFTVSESRNSLVVEEKCKITFSESNITLESEEDELLIAVRDALYNFIAILQ